MKQILVQFEIALRKTCIANVNGCKRDAQSKMYMLFLFQYIGRHCTNFVHRKSAFIVLGIFFSYLTKNVFVHFIDKQFINILCIRIYENFHSIIYNLLRNVTKIFVVDLSLSSHQFNFYFFFFFISIFFFFFFQLLLLLSFTTETNEHIQSEQKKKKKK